MSTLIIKLDEANTDRILDVLDDELVRGNIGAYHLLIEDGTPLDPTDGSPHLVPERDEAKMYAAAPLMHMALEAHAAWHWAENTSGVSTFHENMELANYSQWLTARALAQAAGMSHTEDFSGVPRLLIGFDGLRIDRATQQSAQAIVDRLIGDYRAAIAKATGNTNL